MRLSYSLRLRISGETVFFGPGVEELLRLVDATGSLHTASAQMKMSYSKAWKMVKNTEKELGFPILTRQAGGSGGGYSLLTPEGRAFLEQFCAFQDEVQQAGDQLFKKYFLSFKGSDEVVES